MNERNSAEILKGIIENVVYRNEQNEYTVLDVVDSDDNLVCAVGVIPMASEGEHVVLYGRWVYHKEYGKQFAFDNFEKTLPEDEDGILQYLSSGTVKGVGPVTALKLVNRFGEQTFEVIEHHPEWLTDIPGITMKKAAAISKSFCEQSSLRGVMMFCKDYMGAGEASRVYKKFGNGAVGLIQDNPYILCDGEVGIPFERVDALAMSLGIARDSKIRLLNGLKFALSHSASVSGHTCLPEDRLVAFASELLGVESDSISNSLGEFLDEGELSCYKKDDGLYVMTNETAEAEDFVARQLSKLTSENEKFGAVNVSTLIQKVEGDMNVEFAPLQREAIFASLECGAMVLTGGPGTGKTTVIKALLSIYRSMGFKVVLAAPTGRAAKRMSEATGEEAKTIHRMLDTERSIDGITRFGRNERNPLSEQVIIIDEASMIDLFLMSALVRAMRRGSRLILIGDSDQLPSVGAGNVLADLISSERIRMVRLSEIFRQSKESLIITNAHKINEGSAPILNVTDNDFFFVRCENEAEIADTIANLLHQRLPKAYGEGIKSGIQVITPSKKGAGGVETLNAALQARLNPKTKFKQEKSSHGVIFREGDRVMQVTNNYDVEWEKYGIGGVGLFNGDIGVIETINLREENMTIIFDDKTVEYSFDMLEELELAYAVTVHKSQGSEYPIVVIPMYACAPMLMTRNLFYTAVTRAKNMVILVGRSDIPRKMVENNRQIFRYTALKDKICEYI